MSKKEWTPDQTDGFTARGGTLLLSAAAGSGKTAVLVERVIHMMTKHNVDVDKLLIVTFTRAAAAEMRQRLCEALAEKMAQEPDNERYIRQQMLLPRTHISTIHGFCTKLLQEFSAEAGVPFGFRVLDDNQAKLYKAEALDQALEQSYQLSQQNKAPGFTELAAQLCGIKNDTILRKAVLSAYEFMQAQPFPERWLQQQIAAYTEKKPLEQTEWMAPIIQELEMALERMHHWVKRNQQLAEKYGIETYKPTLQADLDWVEQFQIELPTMTYDEMRDRLMNCTFASFSTKGTFDDTQKMVKKQIQAIRSKLKKRITNQLCSLFPCSESECRDDLRKLAPLVEALGRLVLDFTNQYTAIKRQQKMLDYNDLEHETLCLLVDADGKPTPLAREISNRFAEIMVDECQDINAAQNELFIALSKEEKNLFMVGDVKQSIYGFRQAMPAIFTGRRSACTPYKRGEEQFPATITLGKNFRSREQVTESVNFLFSQLMMRRLGDVEYDDKEELKHGAEWYPPSETTTEWMLLDQNANPELTSEQIEARQIGRRILELKKTMKVYDSKKEKMVDLTDSHICILHRKRDEMPTFVKELTKMGIPVAVDKGERFLETPEVSTALSLLRVIDNPLRDAALAAVMLSPVYGFTPDELAQVRLLADEGVVLYVAVEQAAQRAEKEVLTAKLNRLLLDLKRFRTLAVTMPADRLLETVLRETDMEAVFSARVGGAQRVANLHQLDQLARSYDPGEYRGLSAFIRYVDRVEESGEDLPSGDTLQQEGVKLMTVHGSKGLEFPVVFVSRLGRERKGRDDSSRVLFHAQAGIGMKLMDEEKGEKHTPLPFTGVRTARRIDSAAEELRLWYVALTRAREKLIMVTTLENPEGVLEQLESEITDDQQLLPDTLLRARYSSDILLAASLRQQQFRDMLKDRLKGESADDQEPLSATVLCALDTLNVLLGTAMPSTKYPWRIDLNPIMEEVKAKEGAKLPEPDEALAKTLIERREFTYDYAGVAGLPAKLAASQLSHQKMSQDYIAKSRPAFLQTDGLTAAQKGTAMHTFMQFADYEAACTDLPAEIDRLTAADFLTSQQATSLDLERLAAFFAGPLYRRMVAAQRVWREYPFVMMVPAESLPNAPSKAAGEEVLVQGIADCVFREGDSLVLVDYKTDRVKTPEELCDRYRTQMEFYKTALETILGLPVKETLLYSFALGQTVEVML